MEVRSYLSLDCGPPGAGSGAHRPPGSQNGWHSLRSHRRRRGDRPSCPPPQPDDTSAGCRHCRNPRPVEASRGLGVTGRGREVSRDGLGLPLPMPLWAQPPSSPTSSQGAAGSWYSSMEYSEYSYSSSSGGTWPARTVRGCCEQGHCGARFVRPNPGLPRVFPACAPCTHGVGCACTSGPMRVWSRPTRPPGCSHPHRPPLRGTRGARARGGAAGQRCLLRNSGEALEPRAGARGPGVSLVAALTKPLLRRPRQWAQQGLARGKLREQKRPENYSRDPDAIYWP